MLSISLPYTLLILPQTRNELVDGLYSSCHHGIRCRPPYFSHIHCFNHTLLSKSSDFFHSFIIVSQSFPDHYIRLPTSTVGSVSIFYHSLVLAKMLFVLVSILSVASLGHSSIIRRQDPGMQQIPTTAKADNTFNNGAPQLNAEPDQVTDTPPAVYGARSVDLPFGRLYHGNMMFFSAGELNTPTGIKDEWINTPANPTQNGIDSANQSACGIPDNAFSGSKVAIHPYFLKYADLSRKSSRLLYYTCSLAK